MNRELICILKLRCFYSEIYGLVLKPQWSITMTIRHFDFGKLVFIPLLSFLHVTSIAIPTGLLHCPFYSVSTVAVEYIGNW